MASEDIKALLEEQKKTTAAIESMTVGQEKSNEDISESVGESADAQSEQVKEGKKGKRADKKTEGGRVARAKQSFKSNILRGKIFGKMAGFLGTMAKGAMGKGLKAIMPKGGIKSLLKKGAFLALLGVAMAFLNSDMWKKMQTFIVDKVMPALTKLYHDAIVPAFTFLKDKILPIFVNLFNFLKNEILPIFTVFIVDTWNNIKVLFTDISDAFDKIFSGDILGGILDLVKGIGKFVTKQIDLITTYIYNIIAKIFGLEETDSVYGSIKKFFTDTYDSIVEWVSKAWTAIKDFFIGIFTWGKKDDEEKWSLTTFITTAIKNVKDWFIKLFSWASKEDEGESWIVKTIKGVIESIKEFFGKMFKFDSTSDVITSIINVLYFIPNLIATLVLKVTKWLLKLFGFGEAAEKVANAEGFTIGGLIMGAVKAIVKFLKKIFDIDFGAVFKNLISKVPGATAVLDFFGFGGKDDKDIPEQEKKPEKTAEEIENEEIAVVKAKIDKLKAEGVIADTSGQVDEWSNLPKKPTLAEKVAANERNKSNLTSMTEENALNNIGNNNAGNSAVIQQNTSNVRSNTQNTTTVRPVSDGDPMVRILTNSYGNP